MFPRRMLLVLGVSILVMTLAAVSAETEKYDMANALKILQDLDRVYMQIARPRLTRSDTREVMVPQTFAYDSSAFRQQQPMLERAVRLLKLHTLDKFYSHHTRPRFGKRNMQAAWETENQAESERPENLLSWYSRRR